MTPKNPNNLSPFITAMDGLLSVPNVPMLAAIGVWHTFLNCDTFIDSLTDRQFDLFMMYGRTLLKAVQS